MSSEANQVTEEKKQFSWQGISTDLASFNAYGVVTLSDGQQVNVQMTLRHGLTPDKAYDDFKNFVKLLDLAAQDHAVKFWDGSRKENGNTPTKPADGSAPATNNGDKPKRSYKDPIPQGELPEELAETNENVYAAEFDYFKVLPQPDNKAIVEFWKDGMEFPVGAKMNKWKHDTIKQAFVKLTEQAIDPSKAEQYRIAGTQYFVLGNEFTITQGSHKGEKSHYKNIVLLKPIF